MCAPTPHRTVLNRNGEAALRAVACSPLPDGHESYAAITGEGATCNGEPIHASERTLAGSIIHIGDFSTSANAATNATRLQIIQRLAGGVERIRMVGSASTDQAWVAAGRADAWVVLQSHPWDLLLGSLLVTEAGGRVSSVALADGTTMWIISQPGIHDELKALLSDPSQSDTSTGGEHRPGYVTAIRAIWQGLLQGWQHRAANGNTKTTWV